MDRIHFCSAGAALCNASDARWCTILRDAVSCPSCVALIAERELLRAASRVEARGAVGLAEKPLR